MPHLNTALEVGISGFIMCNTSKARELLMTILAMGVLLTRNGQQLGIVSRGSDGHLHLAVTLGSEHMGSYYNIA